MPGAGPPACATPCPRGPHAATGPRPWALSGPPAPALLLAARRQPPPPGVARRSVQRGTSGHGTSALHPVV
eukprot:329633-Pleurochrysis_carterae.AAC.1